MVSIRTTKGKIRMRKNLANLVCLLILLLSLASCGIPAIYKIDDDERYSDLQCLSPKKKMMIYRTYKTCLGFSKKPEPYTKYWKIVPLNDLNLLKYDQDLKFRYKALSDLKVCDEPAFVTLRYLLGHGEKIFVDRVVEVSDSWRMNRLFIYGTWVNVDLASEERWKIEIKSKDELNTKERILSIFSRCSDEN